jgi:hypothetical protein
VYQRAFSQRGRRAMVGETASKASAVNCAGLPKIVPIAQGRWARYSFVV